MSAIILELQRDALDKKVPLSDLLRKALVAAKKLKLTEFERWVEQELSGYTGAVPEYRVVRGTVKGLSPYQGWLPLQFSDAELMKAISTGATAQSVAELEDLVSRSDASSNLQIPFSPEKLTALQKAIDEQIQITLFVDRAALVGTLDAVRTIILTWALRMEREGVLGEGLSFSEEEKQVARHSPQNINNFYGPVHSAQIAQASPGVTQTVHSLDLVAVTRLMASLKKAKLGLAAELAAEFDSEIATVEAQAKSPRPKEGVIRESLKSIRNILEGAGGGVAAQYLLELVRLLGG